MRTIALSKSLALAAALLAVGFSGRALAQRNDPNSRNDQPSNDSRQTADLAGAEGQKEGNIDRIVADQLLTMSTGEVQLANFALQHTQSDAVRQFAQMMIQDHNKLNTELEKFANPDLVKALGNISRQTGQPGQLGAAQPGQLVQPGQPVQRRQLNLGRLSQVSQVSPVSQVNQVRLSPASATRPTSLVVARVASRASRSAKISGSRLARLSRESWVSTKGATSIAPMLASSSGDMSTSLAWPRERRTMSPLT